MLFSFPLSAQFIFQNLNEKDGLSSKHVRCIYKDKDGLVWIGTANSLNRFDGNFIKRYPGFDGQKNLYVNAIVPFENDNKLLVASSTGLFTFDKKLGRFQVDQRFRKLFGKDVLSFKRDSENRLWIVSTNGLHILQNGTVVSAKEVFPFLEVLDDTDFSFSGISAFCWDQSRKGFWIGGVNPCFVDLGNKHVFDRYNNPLRLAFFDQRFVTSVVIDKKHNLWFSSTSPKTLSYWNPATNQLTTYDKLGDTKMTDGCNYLFIDKSDRLWISTWMYAAYVKYPNSGIQKVPYSQDAPYSIAYGHFNDAVEDDEGNIWLATINGLSRSQIHAPFRSIYKLPSFDFFLDTGFAHANFIVVSGDTIVAAKEDGIIFYNTNLKTYKRFAISRKNAFEKNIFIHAAKSRSGWWFAGIDGIYRLKPGSDKLQRFDRIKKDPFSPVANFVFEDSQGRIWFQVDALYRYDPITDEIKRFDGKDPAYGFFKYMRCQSYLKLRNGDLLFSMNKSGFVRYNQHSDSFSSISVANSSQFNVPTMVEDDNGILWCGVAERGILKMRQNGTILDSLTTASGFPFDYIASLTIDAQNSIWAANADGLLFFKPYNKEITRVNVDLGKTLQDHWNYVYSYQKKVYAVMLDHVVVIDPFKFSTIPIKKAPRITSVRVFEKEVSSYHKLADLELAPHDNFITFQYTSPNHRDVPSLQYSYQLGGLDDSWITAGRNLTASYNNLQPGLYTFRVRSTDENGKWMPTFTSMRVRVRAQWWQTWWFAFFSATFFAFTIHFLIDSHQRRRRKMTFDETIDYFANSVYGENSVSEICWDIARNCITQLRFEDCVVYLWDADKNKLVQKAAYGPTKNVKEHEILNPLELEIGEGIVGAAAATRRPVIVKDTSRDKRYIVDDQRRLSELAVPILHDGKLLGVVDSEHSERAFFNQEHARALMTIASISATKIAEAQAEEQAQQKEIMLLEINKMLAESQLMALRAQMNPHFVFNCLNSIQECIVTEKYGEASKYLNKFSRLFRMVLNNSDRNLVTIEEEEDVLKLYLELEQMRFEQSFTYEIIIDEDLEAEEIVLPSMLLQPYVENALWHGLMHKDGDRQLTITFERMDDDIFRCLIEDNGIGRKKSLEIKQYNSKAKRHKSKGLQIAKDRLDLLERQGQHASVEIIDKYDPEGNPEGTLVVIELSTLLSNT
ncbi:histidine kinase [Dyadobacter sp. Leaf189]|uniref:histidine kinase n=1 Tax=Dyadobacter sp. Leaf189 TaxID=1736295 RepID=UPI001E48BE80|nr:histidine kinase [Dyadobacter sp. Leaf189]